MTRAIKIEHITEIDPTAASVLRTIALHLGADEEKRVDYNLIAKSLNLKRSVVASAIDRMVKKRILIRKNGKLSIPNSVLIQ